MNFLIPAAAWAFLLAAPIILFYLLKSKMRPRPVSTLLFWDQIKPTAQSSPFWRKLRRLFSLLLQLFLLTMLVLALMQPGCQSREEEATQTVYILDRSPSMEAGDLLAEAETAILEELRGMRSQDAAALLASGEPPEVLSGWQANRRRLSRLLEEHEWSVKAGDLLPTLELARELIQKESQGRIVLVTDGVHELPETIREDERLEILQLGAPASNAGITRFAARRARQAPGQFQLSAEVDWTADPPERIEFEVKRNGQLLDVLEIATDQPPPWRKEWTGELSEDATFTGRLLVEGGDALRTDDAASITLPAARTVRIGLISEGNRFLEEALAALPGVEWALIAPGTRLPADLDLVILDGVAPPEGSEGIARLLIDPPGSGFWGDAGSQVSKPLISSMEETEPLLRYVDLTDVQVERATPFEVPAEADRFAESFGTPMLFGRWRGEGRWLVLPFDPASGDLVLRTAFPIFLTNVVLSLQGGLEGKHADLPGGIETRLARTPVDGESVRATAAAAGWAGVPVWWWMVLLALVWVFGEWWSYQRRITE